MACFGRALQETYGVKIAWEDFRGFGRTDSQVMGELLALAGIDGPSVANKLDQAKRLYLTYLSDMIQGPEHVDIMPGILLLLKHLKERPECMMGIITGNFEAAARVKLSSHGLEGYFACGAFGDDSSDRNELARLAVSRATIGSGSDMSRARTFVIGDTMHDVRCGKAINATTIAVGTGAVDRQKLLRENPDHFFEDLSDTQKILDLLLT